MRYGEIVKLGRHILMCGDATNRDDVYKLIGDTHVDLVLTDPPYGDKKAQRNDGVIGGNSKAFSKIIGNESTETAQKNYEIIKDLNAKIIIWGGHYFTNFLPPSRCWIFWDKQQTAAFGDGELAWTNFDRTIKSYPQKWNGMIKEGSKKLNPMPKIHPTQKPVELHMRILDDFSKPGYVILDCFGGSGTTLIGCEMMDRKCLMMEISPDYCDIIVDRFNKLERRIDFE